MREIQKPIGNGYYITSKGNVVNEFFEIQKLRKNKGGYLTFKGRLVHRLVATSFLPNPAGKPIVNHIDQDRENNDIKNLEWATHKENSNRTILQSKSYHVFKKVYEVYGDKHLSEFLENLLKE